MSKATRLLFLFSILFLAVNTYAQRLGYLPSKTKWQQLRDDSLRVIFPAGEEETARRVASLMLKLAAVDPIAQDSRYKPISVVLQPQTNVSNGYVGLAPYVSVFFIQPNENPFELGTLPWADLLALHEYRHVQQLNAVNTGFSHLMKVLFGDLVFSGMYGLAIANWLREGDAVKTETKWTTQGRGRLSRFTLPFREKCKEEEPWSYYKLRNGSYKIYTPDHYPLGYLMQQYGSHVFGEATWDTIFRVAPRMKPIYDPFSGVVKRYYGKSNRNLYLDAMVHYGAAWKDSQEADVEYPMIHLTEKNLRSAFFDMTYPDADADGNIYCVITTFDSTSAIYKMEPDGSRKKIVSLGFQHDTEFDFSGNRLVWCESRIDPRWIRKDKNVIVVYDMHSRKKKDIDPVKGYFMPSLDTSGNKIIALHVDLEGNYNLQILDAVSGDVIRTLPNDENLYLGYPIFSEDAQDVIATARNKEGKMCLVEQNINSGVIKQITPYGLVILGRPVLAGEWIFLTTSLDELDQVYAVDRNEGIFYKVSGGNRAHYDPTWDPVQQEIVTSEYTITGKKLIRVPNEMSQWEMTNMADTVKFVPEASGRDLLAEVDTSRSFEIKKYSPWSNAINLHSWIVTADDPVWGIELRSDDIMSNVMLAAGYEYNRNNKVYGPYFDARLGMWFTELDFGISKLEKRVTDVDGSKYQSINEEVYGGLTLPFYFTPGIYNQVLNLSTTYNAGVYRQNPKQDETDNLNYDYVAYRLLLINSRRKAHRQPNPSWGQRLNMSYAHQVSGVTIAQFFGRLDLALPSFKPSNYVLLTGEYLSQNLEPGSLQLGSIYAGARGFNRPDADENYRIGITYGFPLFYPDFGLGNVLYTRRIRLQPFFDMAYTSDPESPSSILKSAGAELLVDFEFANITIGFRFSRLLSGYDGTPNRFEMFIPSQRF
ncbi:MAG: hypothetical protein KAY48_03840 [Saprospiraceae bacterium]|nr:hypothetical protein [Saprospiraceae bacterium]